MSNTWLKNCEDLVQQKTGVFEWYKASFISTIIPNWNGVNVCLIIWNVIDKSVQESVVARSAALHSIWEHLQHKFNNLFQIMIESSIVAVGSRKAQKKKRQD